MKAAVVTRYGPPDVIRVTDRAMPRVRNGEVLVRIRSAAVTSADARIRAARFPAGFAIPARLAFGITRPRQAVLGSAFSGVIEHVAGGTDREGFSVGDNVCGMTGTALGAHAEFVAVHASRIVRKPDEVSHDDAAGVLFGGTTALYFLRDRAAVSSEMSVLINGASGAVGTNAVQLAALARATVTAVTSPDNVELVTRLGAAEVIDYRATDLSRLNQRFDVVFDTVGSLDLASGRRLLTDNGRLILAVATLAQTMRARGNVIAGAAPEKADDFAELLGLVAGGQLHVVIEQTFPLDSIVDAHRRIDTGHKVGNLVVQP